MRVIRSLALVQLSRPLQSLVPSRDAAVLGVLAIRRGPLSGREIARLAGVGTGTAQRVLARLVDEGLVDAESFAHATMFQLNRDHLLAPHVEAVAELRDELVRRLREEIATWSPPPRFAALFGSTARGASDARSDLDLFFVRPAGVPADDPAWEAQVDRLSAQAARWTGNDARPMVVGEEDLGAWRGEPVVREVVSDGIVLAGEMELLSTRPRRRAIQPP